MIDESIKQDFPFLKRGITYLDNAATSQRPIQVIEAISSFYRNHNANVHRGIHNLSQEASDMYDNARKRIAEFIGASPEEIIFTRNTTEGLNIASMMLKPKRTVTTTEQHHSNLLPWRMRGKIDIVGLDGWYPDMSELEKACRGADVLAISHASNVLGTINPVKEMAEIGKSMGCRVVVDAAQSAPHMKIDVDRLGADILAFSGHKMLGPMGIGVLYVKREILERIDPVLVGGGMISDVTKEGQKWAELPWKFEAGTPNVAGAIGLAKAVEYLEGIGMGSVERHSRKMGRMMYDMLHSIGLGKQVLGPEDRSGLVSFTIPGIHPHDVASFLSEKGIAVRTGKHCAHPLHYMLGLDSTIRASAYIYNNKEDIGRLEEALVEIMEVIG